MSAIFLSLKPGNLPSNVFDVLLYAILVRGWSAAWISSSAGLGYLPTVGTAALNCST